jgi:UDP-2,3-diacylglucosamine pyrophosphatase LpxH
MLALYWDIGRMIAGKQMDVAHGDAIFVLRDLSKVQRFVAQIRWTHNLIVLQPFVQQRAEQLSSFCLTAQKKRAKGGRDRGRIDAEKADMKTPKSFEGLGV